MLGLVAIGACSTGRGVGVGNDEAEESDDGGQDTLPGYDVPGSTGPTDESSSEDSGGDEDDPDGGLDGWDFWIPDAPGCQPGPDSSYIWVANSPQGTVSKINTQTMIEEARYLVRPDGAGLPSRTGVSLNNDTVVASRTGGLTKFITESYQCSEQNGMVGLQTSHGADDVLDWATEECRAWHTAMNYESQRAVAWAYGQWNDFMCRFDEEVVWTSGAKDGGAIVDVLIVDGDDGSVLESTGIVGLDMSNDFGLYGGAVDGDENFWGTQRGQNGRIVRVSRDDLSYELWDTPNSDEWYGMAYDGEGYVWLCADEVARFDVLQETWETASVGGTGGCAISPGDELLWVASGEGLVGVDRWNFQILDSCADTNGAFGVGSDVDGYVWTLPQAAAQEVGVANRVDPYDCEVATYEGLEGPYTYNSNMATSGLSIMW